jgi:predicted O-methyltransferase YrrM
MADKIFRALIRSIVAPFAIAGDEALRKSAYALKRALHLRAIEDTADVVRAEMPDALFCEDRFEHLEYALSLRPPGLVLEFGVFRGTTIRLIAQRCAGERVYGFDSFKGLPERWVGSRNVSTTMDRGGTRPGVPPNVELIAGLFGDTLPGFLTSHPDAVGFVHIDCDLYSSTRHVLNALKGRMAEGCVLVFDEFFGYHGFKAHEYRAFHEFIAESGRKFRFVSYSGAQATVIIES